MDSTREKRMGLHGILTILCVLSLTLPTVTINQCFAIVAAFQVQEEQENETKSSIGSCSHRELKTCRHKQTRYNSSVVLQTAPPVPPAPRTIDIREDLAS